VPNIVAMNMTAAAATPKLEFLAGRLTAGTAGESLAMRVNCHHNYSGLTGWYENSRPHNCISW